jgi:hypothetical protein
MGSRQPVAPTLLVGARAALLSPRLVTALAVGALAWAAVTWWLILSFASASASGEPVGFGLSPDADEIASLSVEVQTLRESLDALTASGGIAPAPAFGAFAAPAGSPPTVDSAAPPDAAPAVAVSAPAAPPAAETAPAAPELAAADIYPALEDLLAPDTPFRWWDDPVPEVLRDFDGPIVTDGRDLYSCQHFDSWAQAQALYEANLPGDPNRIDGDGNGVACEKLRGR